MAPAFEGDVVDRTVRSFHRLSGAGPSGFKPIHLRQAFVTEHRDELLHHTTALVQLLAQGRAPRSIAPVLAGASLSALPKKDGNVRPIAVGETWRRLVAKCLCKETQSRALFHLYPLQIGVSLPLGTEAGIKAARQWCQRNAGHPDKVMLKIDFENAFNCVDRQQILQQCRDKIPSLSPWAEWCYAEPSKLWFGESVVSSESGVQQGDPLGPLLFSLALQPLLEQAKREHGNNGLDLVFAYLDDCVLAGDAAAVAQAFNDLRASAAAIGLKISMGRDKSLLVPCAKTQATFDRSLFPQDLEVQLDGNFELLGSAIGDAAHCRNHTTERINKACKLLQELGAVPDPAVALLLLRHCASFSKLVFSCRSMPHTVHATAIHEFDQSVRSCLESFLCANFSDSEWSLASLSTTLSGLGLRRASRHSCAAYLASSYSCQDLCRMLDPAFSFDLADAGSDVAAALADYNAQVSPEDRLTAASPPDKFLQKSLSKALDNKDLHAIKQAAQADPKMLAHLELTGAARAGQWLHVAPSPHTRNSMDPFLFRISIQRWLRAPIADDDAVCPLCNGVLDKYGDHCLVCPNGGDRTKRHNHLRNRVHFFANSAGLNPELERPGLLPPRPFMGASPENGIMPRDPSARRPADVYLPRWRLGIPMALDFAVTSGMRDDTINATILDASSAAVSYEGFKNSHMDTARLCQDEGLGFTPVIVEAHGGAWGPAAQSIFSELANCQSQFTGESKDMLLSQLYQNLGVILHRENARAVLRRFRKFTHNVEEVLDAATTLQSAAADAAVDDY